MTRPAQLRWSSKLLKSSASWQRVVPMEPITGRNRFLSTYRLRERKKTRTFTKMPSEWLSPPAQ